MAKLNLQRKEASTTFSVLMICVCVYLFLWSFLRYIGIEPPGHIMNLMVEGISTIMFFVILNTTSFSIKDIGLRVVNAKNTFVPAIAITVVVSFLLVIGKIVILKITPGFFRKELHSGTGVWEPLLM